MKVIKNNIYMLKLCFKAAPKWISFKILGVVLSYVSDTFISLFFMRFIIDSLQAKRVFSDVLVMIAAMFILKLLVSFLQDYTDNVLEPQGNIKVTALLMEMLYGQAVSVDLSCYETPEFYDTYTRANEQISQYAGKVIWTLTQTVGIIASIIISLAAICTSEPLIIVLATVPVIVEQFWAKKYTKYKYDRDKNTAYERRQVEYVNRIVYLQDFAKDLRLTNIFNPILKSFEHAVDSMRETSRVYGVKIGMTRFLRTIVSELLVYLGVQGLIVYRYLVSNAYTLGELSTLLNAAEQFSDMIGRFSWFRSNLYESGMFIENFRTFMSYETRIPENADGKIPQAGNSDICFKNVSFCYEGSNKKVLKAINMTIKKGEKIAIVGHNGAGKSTFIKLLLRLYDATEGSIEVGGTDIKEYRLSAYRNLFGTIFQDFKIFAASITENVIMRRMENENDVETAREALKKSGILKKIEGLEKGMDSRLTKEFDKDGIIMSGGEFQKLAIARVFAKNSDICILDEPSSALDPLSEYEVFENMLQAGEGKTVIFISHRLSSTVRADKIYMFENGEIIESGSHEELMKKNGRYAEMYSMQAKRYQEEKAYEA